MTFDEWLNDRFGCDFEDYDENLQYSDIEMAWNAGWLACQEVLNNRK